MTGPTQIERAVLALIEAPFDWRTLSPAQVAEVVLRGAAGESANEIEKAVFGDL